jgi:hypothetical protein
MLDLPPQNKMIQTPPAKKEFHFAATAEHFAEVVYAETIQEAEAIYHKVKRLINPPEAQAEAISTPAPAKVEEGVQ